MDCLFRALVLFIALW